MPPPDVVILAADWNPRALLRAQLIEEGFEVVAVDGWPEMRSCLRPGAKPKLAIVDLEDLDRPADVLRDLKVLMKPDCVLVLTALGTVAPSDVESLGFHAVHRPVTIEDVVASAKSVMAHEHRT